MKKRGSAPSCAALISVKGASKSSANVVKKTKHSSHYGYVSPALGLSLYVLPAMKNGAQGHIMRGCTAEHEFLEIGGKERLAFERGQINSEEKSADEFIKELKRDFIA